MGLDLEKGLVFHNIVKQGLNLHFEERHPYLVSDVLQLGLPLKEETYEKKKKNTSPLLLFLQPKPLFKLMIFRS